MIFILLAILTLVKSHENSDFSLFLSTFYDKYKPADIIENCDIQPEWKDTFSDKEIDVSSYKKFYIWTEASVSRNITITAQSDEKTLNISLSEGEHSSVKKQNITMTLCDAGIQDFIIEFECLSASSNSIWLEIWDGDFSYPIQFNKNCESGIRDDLMIYLGEEENFDVVIVDEGKTVDEWTNGTKEITGHDAAFSLYIDLGVQLLKDFEIKTELKCNIIGPLVNLHYLIPGQKTIKILFLAAGSGFVEITLHIDPYDPVTFKWKQIVPESDTLIATSLNIGTEPNLNDIIHNGKIVKSYTSIPSTDYWTNFFISHKTPIKIGPPILTTNQHILQPEMVCQSKDISLNPSLCALRYRCINDGITKVKVTISIRDSAPVEFDLMKTCSKPKIKIEKDHNSYSGIFTIGVLFSAIAMVGYLWATRKNSFRLLINQS